MKTQDVELSDTEQTITVKRLTRKQFKTMKIKAGLSLDINTGKVSIKSQDVYQELLLEFSTGLSKESLEELSIVDFNALVKVASDLMKGSTDKEQEKDIDFLEQSQTDIEKKQ